MVAWFERLDLKPLLKEFVVRVCWDSALFLTSWIPIIDGIVLLRGTTS